MPLLAIGDCDIAISLDPSFLKSYIRKVVALIDTDECEYALKTIALCRELSNENETILKDLENRALELIRLSKLIPADHPVKLQTKNYSLFCLANGAKFNKFNIGWKDSSFSYMYAIQDIQKGEDIITIPYDMW